MLLLFMLTGDNCGWVSQHTEYSLLSSDNVLMLLLLRLVLMLLFGYSTVVELKFWVTLE